MTAFLLLAFTTFSQSIKPDKILVEGTDTLFCWKLDKSKLIAQELSHLSYCDTLMLEFEERNDLTDSLLVNERRSNTILKKENENLSSVITEKDNQINIHKEMYKEQSLKLKRTTVGAIAICVLSVVLGLAR